MDKMVSYIFGSLESSEKAIRGIVKCLRKQNKINRSFAMFALACGIYAAMNEKQRKQDIEKIDSLTKEVEELKKMKGE